MAPTSFRELMSQDDSEQDNLDALINSVSSSFEAVSSGVPAEPAEPEVVKEPIVLEENQILLSSITDGRLPESGTDYVIDVCVPETFASEDLFNVPKVDDEYYWDVEVLEALVLAYQGEERILLKGMPGTGKTTAIQQFSAHIKKPFIRINGKDGIEPSSFWGTPWVTDGEMGFELGLVPRALLGKYVLCVDEIFKIPPGIMMTLQSLFEKNGSLVIDDMPGTPAEKTFSSEDCFICCSDNTAGVGDNIGQFSSTQLQDTSFLDRIGLTKNVEYLSPTQEVKMLTKRFPEGGSSIKQLVSLANLIRKAYSKEEIALTLSVRGLTSILGLMERGLKVEKAVELAYINKLADDAERGAAINFLRSV